MEPMSPRDSPKVSDSDSELAEAETKAEASEENSWTNSPKAEDAKGTVFWE